ncbi:MAG: hypothetical protein H0W02_10105 [Ktedonobacteraceae bacterium]|nr:hypothetical protein [Ktedonobacteraceae bacterium]
MATWTTAKRKTYLEEHPENFAGPDGSYPIEDGSDVGDAWGLAGHASDPDAVRAKIKSTATRLGLTASLPDTAKEDDDHKERSMPTPDTLARAAADHEPMSGTHSHAHPAFGAHGDDDTHEHEHSHDNDADHHHTHSEERAATPTTAIQVSDRHVMSLPLVRIDATKREVWGQATAEVPDSYGTIFGYYPDAWKHWRGNIREQHNPQKAVGKRVDLECDDLARAIHVGSRVSRGAQDTWLKVEDNVLTGYSASIIPDPEFGPDPKKWPQKEYQGRMYPYLPRYTVAELSLVDNPACPGCDIQIVRADGFATEVLDVSEEETPPTPPALERAGARVSEDTKSKMHQSIAHTLHAAVSQMQNCGCDNCMAAQKMIDPDGDGDIDIGSFDDPDSLSNGRDSDMERAVTAILERALAPVYARLQGIAGLLARSTVAPEPASAPSSHHLDLLMDGYISRAVEATTAANSSQLDEVRASLEAVKGQVDKIAETPVPGAPVQYASPSAATKHLATDPYQTPRGSGSAVYDAVAALSAAGKLDTTEKQVDAVAAAFAAQRRGR